MMSWKKDCKSFNQGSADYVSKYNKSSFWPWIKNFQDRLLPESSKNNNLLDAGMRQHDGERT